MDAVWRCIFAFRNERSMQYDQIYPDDKSMMRETPCVVAASYFEVSAPFVDDNELEKVFKLRDSPLYLRKFFVDNFLRWSKFHLEDASYVY